MTMLASENVYSHIANSHSTAFRETAAYSTQRHTSQITIRPPEQDNLSMFYDTHTLGVSGRLR